jgi:hypothetical protein
MKLINDDKNFDRFHSIKIKWPKFVWIRKATGRYVRVTNEGSIMICWQHIKRLATRRGCHALFRHLILNVSDHLFSFFPIFTNPILWIACNVLSSHKSRLIGGIPAWHVSEIHVQTLWTSQLSLAVYGLGSVMLK